MTSSLDAPSFRPALRGLGFQFKWIGWVSFWLKLVLLVVSLGSVLFGAAFLSAPVRPISPIQGVPVAPAPGTSVGATVPLLLAGMAFLGLSVFWSFRYIRWGRRFLVPTTSMQPSKTETLQLLKWSLRTDLIGALLMVIGAESVGGILYGKALSLGIGILGLNVDPSRFVTSADLLIILACIHSFAGLFVGVASSLWLLQSTTQQRLGPSGEN